ncbi:MAG: DVUA0089 family protein, partial [Cyanobacteria bacterium P01_G01_bin.49]
EEEGTVSAHVFNVTNGTIPEGGIVVGVSAPNLSEFNLDAIEVGNGGEIVNVREDAFDIRLTDFTVLVDLPVAADGEAEGLETASFTLETGDGYEVNTDVSGSEFTITDTRAEVPANFREPNDILPLAQDIGLGGDNSEVIITETIGFEIGNRYQNQDGSFTYVDDVEDVDFYKFDLEAGDIVSFDSDARVRGNPDIPDFAIEPLAPLAVLRIFDAEGTELAAAQNGSAPGELFASFVDAYLEFEAPESGTYYLGVSAFSTGAIQRIASPENWGGLAYDPFIPASGDGDPEARINLGEYEITVALNPDELVFLGEQPTRPNNTPPETIDTAQEGEPRVSLNFSTGTFANFADPRVISGELEQEDLISNGVIEGYPQQGSVVNLLFTTEGEIPEEGILLTVNSDIYLRDYISSNFLKSPPFTPGAELVDVVTDETGRETGFQLRIFEPATFMTMAANTPYWGDAGFLKPGPDGIQPIFGETDGPEDVTFYLEGGEGYGVSETAYQVTPTFYDNEEQVPVPSVIPEVGLTISGTELIESEETEIVLNFSLSEAPPEEGVLVYVRGDAPAILPQFDVLNTEVSGGVFPTPNGTFNGFFFKVTEQEASVTLSAFEDPFDEGLQGYNLALQETPYYTIDSDASEVNFTIADNPDSVLEVSLRSGAVAVESDNTAGELIFNLTAFPPAEGVEVTVNADDLSEFDAEAITVTGGEITEITDTGFSLNITDATAIVSLPPLSDGGTPEVETATFSLAESTDYSIDPEAPEAVVTVVDIPEQVPAPTEEVGFNDTIAEATDLNLNPFNPTATVTAAFQRREPAENALPGFGVPEGADATEDVDFFSFDLEAGDTLKLDIDTVPFEVAAFGREQQLDSELRLFDADGNELASVNNGAAPDEEFSRDPYLEFTANEAGTYYVGVSQLGNTSYDPLVEDNLSNGSGWSFPELGIYYGEYELNVELASGEGGEGGEEPSLLPVFGTLEGDTFDIGVTPGFDGSDNQVFADAGDDLLDTSAGSGNNRLDGQSGDDTFILGSNDFASGDAGEDSFFLLGGDNVVTGGADADQFWIANGEIPEATNTITDFDLEADVLGIAGLGIGFEGLTLTEEEGNTLIALGDDELAKLLGVSSSSLSADNFVFA